MHCSILLRFLARPALIIIALGLTLPGCGIFTAEPTPAPPAPPTAQTPSQSPTQPTSGRAYYVSPSGDDSNDGLSSESAWRTIERVNAGDYQPGDRILFEGGQTFEGALQFSPHNARGNLNSPILISSYGEGRATLSGGGLTASGVAGFSIENINLTGGTEASAAGISIIHEQPSTLSGLRVVDVEISGFAYAILVITGDPPSRFTDVHLERVSAHDNAAGPSFFGYLTQSGTVSGHYGIGDVYIGDSQFFNHSGWGQYNLGYGLTLMNAENVTIERNLIHDNGGDNLPPGEEPNGPSGITIYDGHNVVIQRNEIWGQRRDPDGPTDNGGIDIWATDSLVQYNYVHDNEGWGMILGAGDPANASDPHPWPSERNTIRYNIFENNARSLPGSTIPDVPGAELLMFGPVKDFDVYNNTFYARNAVGQSLPTEVAWEEAMISIYAVPPNRDPQGLRFRNNLFIAEDQVRFIETTATADIRFEYNGYIGGAATQQALWGLGVAFDSIAAWSEATGQERVDGAFVAQVVGLDALCAPGQHGPAAYKLKPGSPLIDAGADLLTLGIEAGFTDYFGNGIPYPILGDLRSTFDIGAHEWHEGETCQTVVMPPTVLPTPNPDNGIVGAIRWDAWVGELPTFGDATSEDRVGLIVERTLGPAHWHYCLPFYAVEVGENQVIDYGDFFSISPPATCSWNTSTCPTSGKHNGTPLTGWGITRLSTPNTSRTSASVITSAGLPCAINRPARRATT
jgi:hypothetical protein